MKTFIYSIVLLFAVSFISCTKDEPIHPSVAIEAANNASSEGITLPQDGSVVLSAKVEKSTAYTVTWEVNGKQVSTEKTFAFTATELGKHTIVLNVLNHDGGKATAQTTITVYGKYKHGIFVLNEGNMTSENGSLIFISPEGVITDSVYFKVNGTELGNTTQDLFICDNKMYIISQNGKASIPNDGRLVVANAETLKKEIAYNDELSILSWPTHIAVVDGEAYIRDNKGIYAFNLASKTLKYIDGTKGADKNRMAVISNKLFVPDGNKIYVIINKALVHTINMPGMISGVVKSYDDNLWVSCTTSPAQINKIKPSDYTIIQTNELPADVKIGSGVAATPGISAKADTIYFSNTSTKIYRHVFSKNKTEYMTDVKEHIQNAGIVYNNLAVHPVTGEVYFNTIKAFGWDFLINDITVFNFSGTTPVLKADYKNHTHFPAGIFFTDSYK